MYGIVFNIQKKLITFWNQHGQNRVTSDQTQTTLVDCSKKFGEPLPQDQAICFLNLPTISHCGGGRGREGEREAGRGRGKERERGRRREREGAGMNG